MKTNPSAMRSKKWAVVDDDPDVLEAMEYMLSGLTTAKFVTFSDPREAIAAVREAPESFEMLITDRNMPKMDGVGLLVLARAAAPHLRFLIVTGNTYRLEEELDQFDLPHSYVGKPLRVAALSEAIESAESFCDEHQIEPNRHQPIIDYQISPNHLPRNFLRFAIAVMSVIFAGELGAHDGTDSKSEHEHATQYAYAQNSRTANQVSIKIANGYRVISGNGIPSHATGVFPNRGNPNSISAQNHSFRVPLNPRIANRPTLGGPAFFGVAINGVPFEAGTAEFWNRDRRSGWSYEALSGHINLGVDQNNAHVQPTGAYHYHAIPTGLAQEKLDNGSKMILIGWAADGFPIYSAYGYVDAKSASSPLEKMESSYQLKTGTRSSGPGGGYDGRFTEDYEYKAGTGDLDECNGRFGVTPEFPGGTYHYYITEDFPFISRQWKGAPDQSFMKQGGGRGSGRLGGPRRGPRPGQGPPPGGGPSRGI